ncbi:MAG: hypothetical protein M3680_01355 [Myxococcota bacterium]|nr:hypothetical protein [Myxococcota bacterium]
MRGALVVLALAASCGGDPTPGSPDATPTDPPGDAAPLFAACAEFAAPPHRVPAHVVSTLAGADLENPPSCAVVNAPYGAESAGPDRVVPLTGLVVGSAYVVKLSSASDLGFYVTTGCSTAHGPASDQCLLFEDSSFGGSELGRFVATAPTAFVIVDFYATTAPTSAAFTLDVYAEQCTATTGCAAPTPACSEGVCVACLSSFDCTSAAAPRCDVTTRSCTSGIDTCTGDDPAEPADDGPAGARVLAPDGAGVATLAGSLCASPRSEADFVAFDVTTLGETWDFALAWSGTRDLDLEVFDASGRRLGISFWEQPEQLRLTYLPVGRYYVRLREFSPSPATDVVAYALTARRTSGAGCTGTADCARDFRNQLYRGSCEAGACVAIDGGGAVPEGGACDSESDCAPTLACPSFFFVAGADTRQTCARGCQTDAECGPLGGDFVCTTYLADNFCVARCATDDHCPTSLDTRPLAGPWYRLTCNLPTGRCLP